MMLLAFYDGLPVVPVERVCADFFAPLSLEKFTRKVALGEIKLPIARMEKSQRGARAVHLNDLARFLDDRAEVGRKECEALRGACADAAIGGEHGSRFRR